MTPIEWTNLWQVCRIRRAGQTQSYGWGDGVYEVRIAIHCSLSRFAVDE